jgi:hypothetical protein
LDNERLLESKSDSAHAGRESDDDGFMTMDEYIANYVRPYEKDGVKYHDHPDLGSFDICEGCDEDQKVR